MLDTQKQSVNSERLCFVRDTIAFLNEVQHEIDSLIEGYLLMKEMRPEYARGFLISIGNAIHAMLACEEALANEKALTDCPF